VTSYPKRLIEVDLPIRRISYHARNEKDSRLGHIPRLHVYPAARPLAACRAVICAALWPDPADSYCPAAFRDKARDEMQKWAAHGRQAMLSDESRTRFEKARQNPALFNDAMQLRGALLDFIADFAIWDNSTVREYLETSRALTEVAHKSLGVTGGTKPFVFDPFAGGGAIPLEALRVGAEPFASDLNPLAVLITRVVLEHVPEFGERLVSEIERCAERIKEQASAELSAFFPDGNNDTIPIAYLWARTILSEAPSTGDFPIEIPLLRSLWLTRGRSGGNWALRWASDKVGRPQTEIVEISLASGEKRKIKRLVMEVFKPDKTEEVPSGTVRGGAVTCPVTGFTTPVKRVRAQLSETQGGTKTARMYCVVTALRKSSGRGFRVPTAQDTEAVERANDALHERYTEQDSPTEPLPPDGTNGFRVQKYGMRTWGDLFTSRQILTLLTYAKLIRAYIKDRAFPESGIRCALESVLCLLLNRLADLNASLCGWQLNTPNTAHVFVRWALPMVFDFGEVNPLAAAGGSPESALRRMEACIRDLIAARLSKGTVAQQSATHLPLADDMAAALVTDPPYYDAIPYGDLLDFFVVWMKRVCRNQSFTLVDGLSPKAEECVVDNGKQKNHEFFQRTMTQSLAEARRVLAPGGVGVVVFAHKTTAGWEAQLEGLIRAGFSVTASWPIDTEMGSRMRAQGSAALASSIHLVCRPRENPDGSVLTEEIGDWRDVLQELPRRIHDWMPRLAEEGVVGADAIFACLGPALEIFSRYSRVEKASGEAVPLREYLEQVWAAVSREALSMIFEGASTEGFEPDARLTAMWLWTLSAGAQNGWGDGESEESGEDEEDEARSGKSKGGFALEFDAARKIAQGLGAHLEDLRHVVEIAGETARLLPVAERTAYLFGKDQADAPSGRAKKKSPQLDLFAELAQEGVNETAWAEKTVAKIGETTLDRIHQSMILFAAGRSEALKRFLVEDAAGRDTKFWRLAQALSALYPPRSNEKRWVDGVLAKKKGFGL